MKTPIFKGAGVAIVTPFKKGNPYAVDFDKLGKLIDYQIENGTDAIIICGTTGEASTMPDEEHLSVIEYAVQHTAKRVPVIAGAGSNDTRHAIALAQKAERIGADALLCVTPYYNKTTQAGLYEHFRVTCENVSLPVILYNVPGRTGMNINPETLEKLCKIPNVNAIKECNLSQVSDVRAHCGSELNLYSGEDGQVSMMLGAGGLGVISVVSNVFPRYMHDMVMKYLNGDPNGSWQMQADCLDLVKALFCEVNPIPVKAALNLLGFEAGECRPPLCNMQSANLEKLRIAIDAFCAKIGMRPQLG